MFVAGATWLSLVGLALAGCSERALPIESATASLDLSFAIDMAWQPFALDMASQCTPLMAHTRMEVPLAELELLDASTAPRHRGMTLRVRAGIPIRVGCDVPGDMVISGSSNGLIKDAAQLHANVWRGTSGCGAMQIVSRVVAFDTRFAAAHVVIGDGAPGGAAQVGVDFAAGLGSNCQPSLDMRCTLDCQCPMFQCIPTGTAIGICATSCTVDTDCGARCNVAASPRFTCDALRADRTCDPCPFAEHCESGRCVPDPQMGLVPALPDCLCVADRAGSCIRPCNSATDCPAVAITTCNSGVCTSDL